MREADRKALLIREFAKRFCGLPEHWVRAPGRVDLMGSHTDYNEGYVLTLSIDRDTWIAARPRDDRQIVLHSLNLERSSTFDLDAITHDKTTPWSNYVRGVAAILQDEGYRLNGFDGLIHSTVPISSGLSSSAALEVATAILFGTLGKWQVDGVKLALLCQRAENRFVGVNCGILDQYASALGQAGCALMLDCRNLTSQPVPLHRDVRVVICDTKAKRELTGTEYPERRAQCEEGARQLAHFYLGVNTLRDVTLEQLVAHEKDLSQVVARRCRFIIEENQRVLQMGRVLPFGECAAIHALTAASYAGARDLYEIGSSEMAKMIEAMLSAPGIIGARQAGAGFGGSMVAFVEDRLTDAFADHVQQAYSAATGIQPMVYPVQAASGAGLA